MLREILWHEISVSAKIFEHFVQTKLKSGSVLSLNFRLILIKPHGLTLLKVQTSADNNDLCRFSFY
jgi:hypothetical protein